MHIVQEVWSQDASVAPRRGGDCKRPAVVLVFAAPALLREPATWARLKARWPGATIVAGSTAGEISGTRVLDDALVATAVELEHTRVRCARVDGGSSEELGEALAERLAGPDLRHVFVLSDGLRVNGSALVRGLTRKLPPGVSLTGGLCADGARFERTHVCLDVFSEA